MQNNGNKYVEKNKNKNKIKKKNNNFLFANHPIDPVEKNIPYKFIFGGYFLNQLFSKNKKMKDRLFVMQSKRALSQILKNLSDEKTDRWSASSIPKDVCVAKSGV